MNNIITTILGALVLSLTAFVGSYFLSNQNQAVGSVAEGQGYYSTTTDATWVGAKKIRTGGGVLGSINVHKATTAAVLIYDATTTDINKRTGNTATSTITLVDLGTGYTATTYTYDLVFTKGLIVDVSTAVPGIASTTITYK